MNAAPYYLNACNRLARRCTANVTRLVRRRLLFKLEANQGGVDFLKVHLVGSSFRRELKRSSFSYLARVFVTSSLKKVNLWAGLTRGLFKRITKEMNSEQQRTSCLNRNAGPRTSRSLCVIFRNNYKQ